MIVITDKTEPSKQEQLKCLSNETISQARLDALEKCLSNETISQARLDALEKCWRKRCGSSDVSRDLFISTLIYIGVGFLHIDEVEELLNE